MPMDGDNGYIMLDREFIENSFWFNGAKTLQVFIWILSKANLKDGGYLFDDINRGSVVATNEKIANACGLTIANVRTALAQLEKDKKITREYRNHYQIISVTNFDSYIIDPQ